jgi:hypothetical protein
MLVCHISRRALFWGFLLASLPCVFGVVLLILALKLLIEDWSDNLFGVVVILSFSVLSLWGGRALCRQANRLRHVKAVVHTGGLSPTPWKEAVNLEQPCA